MITLHFSGASDDLLYLNVTYSADSAAEYVVINDDGTDSHKLDEISAHRYRGWLVTPEDAPPFAVWALLGPTAPLWSFAIGFPPGTSEDDGADIGMLNASVRQDPGCRYSTELTIQLPGSCSIEAIPGKTEGT